jgi:hypothetical protein
MQAQEHITALMLNTLSQLRFDFDPLSRNNNNNNNNKQIEIGDNENLQSQHLFIFQNKHNLQIVSEPFSDIVWKSSAQILKEQQKSLDNNPIDTQNSEFTFQNFTVDISALNRLLNSHQSSENCNLSKPTCTDSNHPHKITINQSMSSTQVKPKGTHLGVKVFLQSKKRILVCFFILFV